MILFLKPKDRLLLYIANQGSPIISSRHLEAHYPYKTLARLTRLLEEEGCIATLSSSQGHYDCKLLARGVARAKALKQKNKRFQLIALLLIALLFILWVLINVSSR